MVNRLSAGRSPTAPREVTAVWTWPVPSAVISGKRTTWEKADNWLVLSSMAVSWLEFGVRPNRSSRAVSVPFAFAVKDTVPAGICRSVIRPVPGDGVRSAVASMPCVLPAASS